MAAPEPVSRTLETVNRTDDALRPGPEGVLRSESDPRLPGLEPPPPDPERRLPDVAEAVPGVFAGVDVGATRVVVLLMDEGDRVLSRVEAPMARGRHQVSVGSMFSAIRSALAEAGPEGSRLAGIGVGMPGRIDVATGVVRLSVNLGWQDLPLGDLLASEFDVPCWIDKPVHIAAAGLLSRPESAGARSFAYLSVGTAVAAGIVLDGHLYRGSRGMAGEVGHVIVEPEGRRCACGLRGCLETVAAGPAIARLGQEAVDAGLATSLAGVRRITAAAVYQAAREEDVVGLAIAGEVGRALARGIQGLVMTYDVGRVVLGGGVTAAGEPFLAPILAELACYRMASPLAAELLPEGTVSVLPAGLDAVAWGAVALARDGWAADRGHRDRAEP